MNCCNKATCKHHDNYFNDGCGKPGNAELSRQCMNNDFNHFEPADLPEAGASAERISSVIRSARELVNFGDWILASKIQLCDKRCLMQNIETDFGKVKSNQCDRESCPELVFKLLLDNVRAHF